VSNPPVVTAESYARWRGSSLGRITEKVEIELIFALAGALADKRVLDVGTGDGTYAMEAASRGAVVTALDPQPEMLDATRRRLRQGGLSARLRRGRVEALPFGDHSFDIVLAVTVLCFVSDAHAAVLEMARVLVPGGRLVIGELSHCSVWAAQRRVRGWLGDETWKSVHFWSQRKLIELIQAAGPRVDAVRGSVFYPPSGIAAQVLAPIEPLLTLFHAPGAAFLAVAANRPEERT
jgi:ubiquinone/menaquinone biosynthesis C-methylase UbiE